MVRTVIQIYEVGPRGVNKAEKLFTYSRGIRKYKSIKWIADILLGHDARISADQIGNRIIL